MPADLHILPFTSHKHWEVWLGNHTYSNCHIHCNQADVKVNELLTISSNIRTVFPNVTLHAIAISPQPPYYQSEQFCVFFIDMRYQERNLLTLLVQINYQLFQYNVTETAKWTSHNLAVQMDSQMDIPPEPNGAQGVLPCVGWGVRPGNWIYRLWRHCP